MKITPYARVKMLFAVAVTFVLLSFSSHALGATKETTITGIVSDALCGEKHSMQGMSSADCVRMCIKAGQGYALVVGHRVYNLSGHSPELQKYAAQKVAVKGKLKRNTVAVDSVAPAK